MTAKRGFWHDLGEVERDELAAIGRCKSYRPDSVLLHQGEPSSHVLVLMSGWVKVSCEDPDGREVILALLGPGEILGEMEVMLDDPHRSATVTTLLNGVEAIVIPATRFVSFLGRHPNAWRALYRALALRLHDSNRNAREFGLAGVRQALARLLVDLAAQHGESLANGSMAVKLLSQDEIAGCIWASRDSVAHEFHVLRMRGVLETGRRSFTIVDMKQLRRIAGHQT